MISCCILHKIPTPSHGLQESLLWPRLILGSYFHHCSSCHLAPVTSTMISDQHGSFTGFSINSNVTFSRAIFSTNTHMHIYVFKCTYVCIDVCVQNKFFLFQYYIYNLFSCPVPSLSFYPLRTNNYTNTYLGIYLFIIYLWLSRCCSLGLFMGYSRQQGLWSCGCYVLMGGELDLNNR